MSQLATATARIEEDWPIRRPKFPVSPPLRCTGARATKERGKRGGEPPIQSTPFGPPPAAIQMDFDGRSQSSLLFSDPSHTVALLLSASRSSSKPQAVAHLRTRGYRHFAFPPNTEMMTTKTTTTTTSLFCSKAGPEDDEADDHPSPPAASTQSAVSRNGRKCPASSSPLPLPFYLFALLLFFIFHTQFSEKSIFNNCIVTRHLVYTPHIRLPFQPRSCPSRAGEHKGLRAGTAARGLTPDARLGIRRI